MKYYVKVWWYILPSKGLLNQIASTRKPGADYIIPALLVFGPFLYNVLDVNLGRDRAHSQGTKGGNNIFLPVGPITG